MKKTTSSKSFCGFEIAPNYVKLHGQTEGSGLVGNLEQDYSIECLYLDTNVFMEVEELLQQLAPGSCGFNHCRAVMPVYITTRMDGNALTCC